MNYFNELHLQDGIVLSCDKLRLKFVLDERSLVQFNKFVENLSFNEFKYNYQLYTNINLFNYRNMLTFSYNDSVVAIGLCFNSVSKLDWFNCFIEFNPNKSLVNNYVTPILDYIKYLTSEIELVRFDFAIDIPTKRGNVVLCKDKRNYEKLYKFAQSSSSLDNFTEYLGQRNNNGFVKLYNKSIESKLDYDLTRLEITLDSFDYDNLVKELPKVYYYKNVDLITFSHLNDTDRVLLHLLANSNDSLSYLNMLGRVKREKFTNILFSRVELFITKELFFNFCCKLRAVF